VKAAAAATALLLLAAPAAAQSDDAKLKSLLQELDSLIDKGEAQNLADPWFLQDLRALSARYGQTWPVVLLDHRFDSKGSLPKAPWEVRQGEMKMDWSRGLRSRVEAKTAATAKSDEERVGELVGSLLGRALGGKDSEDSRTAAPDPTTPALAVAEIPVSNAFQMTAEITRRALAGDTQGGLELGVIQSGNAGYRLVLVPHGETGAEGGATATLYAVSARGTQRVVDSAETTEAIPDDQPFEVTLARRPNGQMSAALDGQELISASDRSFNDPFTGLLIANRGGDYAVRQMTVRGTE
jgi:hypothetical protein